MRRDAELIKVRKRWTELEFRVALAQNPSSVQNVKGMGNIERFSPES